MRFAPVNRRNVGRLKVKTTSTGRLLLPIAAVWLAAVFFHGTLSMDVEPDARTAFGIVLLTLLACSSQCGLAAAPFVTTRSATRRTIVLISMLPSFGILIASLLDIAPDLRERPAAVGAWFSTALFGTIAYVAGAIAILKPKRELTAPEQAA